jgi:hypothetical protein
MISIRDSNVHENDIVDADGDIDYEESKSAHLTNEE